MTKKIAACLFVALGLLLAIAPLAKANNSLQAEGGQNQEPQGTTSVEAGTDLRIAQPGSLGASASDRNDDTGDAQTAPDQPAGRPGAPNIEICEESSFTYLSLIHI